MLANLIALHFPAIQREAAHLAAPAIVHCGRRPEHETAPTIRSDPRARKRPRERAVYIHHRPLRSRCDCYECRRPLMKYAIGYNDRGGMPAARDAGFHNEQRAVLVERKLERVLGG